MSINHIICYEGKRHVSLAVLQEAYIPIFMEWINLRDSVKGTHQRPPYTESMGREWIETQGKQRGKHEVFAVIVHDGTSRKNDRYIGNTGVHDMFWPSGAAITGSMLGDPTAQGKGYGTEAKLLLQHHAFHVLGLRKLTSSVMGWNAQSLGHLVKTGYKICGRHRRHYFCDGRLYDQILLEVFRKDWEPIWERYWQTGDLPKLTDEERELVSKETKC